jgi:hypothetical protein
MNRQKPIPWYQPPEATRYSRSGNSSHGAYRCAPTEVAMITPTTATVVVGVGLSCLMGDGMYRVLLSRILHLPPSAVPLVSYVRLCRSAQRSAVDLKSGRSTVRSCP